MKRHAAGPGASGGAPSVYGPVHPGLARRNNRWTPERLEALRRLYAAGASLEEIGLSCGLRPGSVLGIRSDCVNGMAVRRALAASDEAAGGG